jgi:hypothetical protein
MKKFLTLLLIFILIFGYSQTTITDANIRQAVSLCFSDPSAARITYGYTYSWDVSQVTDMSNLFYNKPI